jgi:hypothetical protein
LRARGPRALVGAFRARDTRAPADLFALLVGRAARVAVLTRGRAGVAVFALDTVGRARPDDIRTILIRLPGLLKQHGNNVT